MLYYLGIDPGLDGALAIISDNGRAQVHDTPTLTTGRGAKSKREYALASLANLLRPYARVPCRVGIELVGAMPGQGVSSMFRMGYGLGVWEAMLAAFGVSYTRVTPQKWKKAMLEGVGTEKEASRLRAQQLFPHLDLARKKDHGRAEAVLIAEYIRRQVQQGRA